MEGLRYICADSLKECIEALEQDNEELVHCARGLERQKFVSGLDVPDFRDVVGMEGVKRALEVAAAGGHNFLLVGSPGAGKTLCARCLPGILPEMCDEEILEDDDASED